MNSRLGRWSAGLLFAALATVPETLCARTAAEKPVVRDVEKAQFPAPEAALQKLQRTADLGGQRRHLWHVLGELTRTHTPSRLPQFLTWSGAKDVFAITSAAPLATRNTLRAFEVEASAAKRAAHSSGPPLIVVAHYNEAAAKHIRVNALQRRATLKSMTVPRRGEKLNIVSSEVPTFPRSAVVLKSAWWPVAGDAPVAMPVWDAEMNIAAADGNDYPSWRRMVAVCPTHGKTKTVEVELMGRTRRLNCVDIDRFYHLRLDAAMVEQLRNEPTARKLAAMVLGRGFRTGDHLALVALHVATRELPDWVWGTLWWHDSAMSGPFAADRPKNLGGPWSNYLMNVAFDAVHPRERDGSPRVVFNPWLEARFADNGQGSGMVSNCISCHQRATYPAIGPFEVTRGAHKEAHAAGTIAAVETSSLWSLPLQAH
jgi:hypothetical protein